MRESTELGASTRALLDAARGGLGPDAATIARMRGKIGIAVGGGAVAGATTNLFANKLVLALVVAAATGSAVIATRPSAPASERIPATQPAHEHPAPTIATVRESITVASAVDPIELDTAIEIEPAGERSSVTKPIKVKPAARTVDLGREVELVDRAMASLRAGDTTGALAAVRLHAAETGGVGQLAEDAAAIEIDALCKRKDPSAATRLAAFDKRWPASAQRAKLCR